MTRQELIFALSVDKASNGSPALPEDRWWLRVPSREIRRFRIGCVVWQRWGRVLLPSPFVVDSDPGRAWRHSGRDARGKAGQDAFAHRVFSTVTALQPRGSGAPSRPLPGKTNYTCQWILYKHKNLPCTATFDVFNLGVTFYDCVATIWLFCYQIFLHNYPKIWCTLVPPASISCLLCRTMQLLFVNHTPSVVFIFISKCSGWLTTFSLSERCFLFIPLLSPVKSASEQVVPCCRSRSLKLAVLIGLL